MNIDHAIELIADLACELEYKDRVLNHQRRAETLGMNKYEISQSLYTMTGENFGPDLIAWTNWIIGTNKLDLMSEQGVLMLCCRVVGRLKNSNEGTEPD